MKYYYEDEHKIFKLEGKVHEKIRLFEDNFTRHIKIRHREITLEKIQEILEDPDYVYKSSRSSYVCYYEKNYEKGVYRVVVDKFRKGIKYVVTAYLVDNAEKFTRKHVRCIYDKENEIECEEMQKELENDMDYFYGIFN